MTKEERIRLGRGNRTTHGENKTRLHIIWTGMRARCRDKNNMKYGGRGISVCKRWDDSYADFRADVGYPPSDEHNLDRHPNMNGNYEPGNVRWATYKENANNTRKNVFITYKGDTLTKTQWYERLGYSRTQFDYKFRMKKVPMSKIVKESPLFNLYLNHISKTTKE